MISTDDCWLYAGNRGSKNHGQIYAGMNNGKVTKQQAHRVMYENTVGEIPEGLDLDHLCNNPPCINPRHLEPVTPQENTLRHYRSQTHCRNGHEYAEHGMWLKKKSNISKSNPTGESRSCRLCH